MVDEKRKVHEEKLKLEQEKRKLLKQDQTMILGKKNSRPRLSFSIK